MPLSKESADALRQCLRILAPLRNLQERQLMVRNFESCIEEGKWPPTFQLKDIGRLFYPTDPNREQAMREQMLAALRSGELPNTIGEQEAFLPGDLAAWPECPTVPRDSPLRYWLPEWMQDSYPPADEKHLSNPGSQISLLKGSISETIYQEKINKNVPNWKEWRYIPEVKIWQACALSLNIDPHFIYHKHDDWIFGSGTDSFFEPGSFAIGSTKDEFQLRMRVLLANLSNCAFFSHVTLHSFIGAYHEVRLPEFAAWALTVNWDDIPPELVSLTNSYKATNTKGGAKAQIPLKIVKKYKPKIQMQKEAILEWLKKNDFDPKKLPPRERGKAGTKRDVREAMLLMPGLFSDKSFEVAWELLRNDKEIVGAD